MMIKENVSLIAFIKHQKKKETCAYYRLCQSHSLLSAKIISFPFLRETEIKLCADSEDWLKLFNNCVWAPRFLSDFCGLKKPPEAVKMTIR